jgi:hypothetical protein
MRPSTRLRLSTSTPLLALVAAVWLALGSSACGGSSGGARDGSQDAAGAGDGEAGADGAAGGDGATDADGGSSDSGGADGGMAESGTDAGPPCGVGGTGQLVLAVTGLPEGTTPMVRVSMGGLASPMLLMPGTPVTLPAGGGYEIDYRRVKVPPVAPAVIGKAFYVAASSFDGCVQSTGMTTATLMYTQEPGSEHLWISVSDAPTAGDEIAAFAGADVTATAANSPSVWKMNNFMGQPGTGAFDSSGNLWVPGGDVMNMFPMLTLATSGGAAPAVELEQPASAPATFAAFDANGNLWVSRGAPANMVVRYAPTDLAASGAPVPAIVVTSPDLDNPAGLAFDVEGSLWVASEANDQVLRFNGEHLGASFSGPADAALTAKATVPTPTAFTGPNGLAFDQAGNLWVGFSGKLVALTPAQQTVTALVSDPLTLNVSTGTGGFAFDESGGLWTVGDTVGTFRRFPKTALATSGDATPDIVITSSELGSAESLVLDPSPTWSLLGDSL